MIETARYDQILGKKRFCRVCDSNQTEDEIPFRLYIFRSTARNIQLLEMIFFFIKYKVLLQTLSKYPTRTYLF